MLVVQRELSQHLVAEVGYLGSQGHHRLRFGELTRGCTPPAPPTTAVRIPPAVAFLGAVQETMDTVSSNYHSLEGKLSQRYSRGLVYSVGSRG